MKYEYEREAARGDPMPDGLSLAEQQTYQAIRYLYAVYRAKRITQAQAAQEKAKVLRELRMMQEKEALQQKAYNRSIAMWKDLEAAANRYGTERTLENADKLIEAIYGASVKK
jgi:anti-sigma factor ChrR (cupin superfamily)